MTPLWRVGPKQGWGLGGGWGNAQDPQGWKRPWELWGLRLRLMEQKGPRRAPHSWSQRSGDLTWEPSRLPGLEWVGQMPSSPLLLLQSEGASPAFLSWSPQPPSYAPKDTCGMDGVLEVWYRPGGAAGSPARVGQVIALCSSPALPRESLPPSLLISPASGAPILSGLHLSFPLSPPISYRFTLSSSCLREHESPTSSWQVP